MDNPDSAPGSQCAWPNVRGKLKGGIVACTLATFAALGPIVAHADPDQPVCTDNQGNCAADVPGYLSQLAAAGISGDNNAMVKVGMGICADIAHGTPAVREAASLRSTNPTMTLVQGNVAVDTAELFLCPQIARPSTTLPMQ
jgi:hypothetical protein